nr:MAG TPA: hypothetical protein [Caudoviricetes sp.]
MTSQATKERGPCRSSVRVGRGRSDAWPSPCLNISEKGSQMKSDKFETMKHPA